MKRTIRSTVFIGAVLAAGSAFAADPSLCFAFLRGGEVFVSCQGQEVLIAQGMPVNSFAIAEQRNILGIVTSWTVTGAGPAHSVDMPRMVNFKSDKNIISGWYRFGTGGVPALISTCGGLFGVVDLKLRPLPRDLVTGDSVPVDPYTWFRCSADRKVVAGIAEADRLLSEGMPPSTSVAPRGSAAYYEFNISPNGNYLVYASDRQPVCVWSAAGGARCASADAVDNTHDLASVSDDGDVLVSVPTADMCVFKSPADFSLARPGNRNAANCIGIAHWRPGMQSPQIVEPLGRAPQWISPDTASLLMAWARKTKGHF